MYGLRQSMLPVGRRNLHTVSHGNPSLTLRGMADANKIKIRKNPAKDQVFVNVPGSKSYLDTATMPIILFTAGVALFAKILMMIDESKSQEKIERKIRNAPAGQGSVTMLTHEEWEGIQEVRPRTPFESRLIRPNVRIRTDDRLYMEDLKDWTVDVLTDALTRAEETVRRNSD